MKRKTVQTKYDVPVRQAFRWASEQQSCSAEASMIVRIPAPWLTKEIIFVCTVFLSFTLRMTCERTLIHAQSTLWIAPLNLQFTLWNSRLWDDRCQRQQAEALLKTNSSILICSRLCSMQHPGFENPSIPVTSSRKKVQKFF